MLALRNIDVTLNPGTKLARHILHGLNLSVAPGEFVVVIGCNGAGKSTLLNVIAGTQTIQHGTVLIDAADMAKCRSAARASAVARVVQDPRDGTMENLTIAENMALAYKRGAKKGLQLATCGARREYFKQKLQLLHLGLENRLDDLVINLSGGQRQALSLIMAVLANSQVLLLDEITAALDPKSAAKVMQVANDIVRQEQRTCIMITHNMQHALHYGDRLVVLKDGKIEHEFYGHERDNLTAEQITSLLN